MKENNIVFCVALLLFSCTSFIHGMQHFDRKPRYTETNAGDSVVMECRVFNKKGQCVWQKDGKPVGIYSGKYEWVGSPDQGDCSLKIFSVKAEFDAGDWECQVTASAFDAQDALTSEPAPLVVRIAPSNPHLEVNLTRVASGSSVTVTAGLSTVLQCVSRGGNPAPVLKWFLGDRELVTHIQTNTTDGNQPKTWSAVSALTHTFNKTDNNQVVKCVAIHEAFPAKYRETSSKLNVLYAPEVTLVGSSNSDFEEDVDSAVYRCVADANPPATIIWRKVNRLSTLGQSNDIHSFQETLEFNPVSRTDSGTYSCEAKNNIGSSNLVTFQMDVKYPPSIISVGPSVGHQLTLSLYESTRMECQGSGNPEPGYKWLHRRIVSGQETIVICSEEKVFHIANVTYDNQGEYVCVATNVINSQERVVQSEAITVRVVGPPQILLEDKPRFATAERGDDIVLRAAFCADPRPVRVSWHWPGVQLEAGTGSGRFIAEALRKVNQAAAAFKTEPNSTVSRVNHTRELHPLPHYTSTGKRDDCFESRFRIQRVEFIDARHYYLTVENDKGTDTVYVILGVKEPVSMATVVAIVIASLFVIILMTLCLLYAHRSRRCCFSRKDLSKSTDLESMKSDVESVHSSSGSSTKSSKGPKTIKTDASPVVIDPGKLAKDTSKTTNPRPSDGPYKTNITINGAYVEIQHPNATNPFTVPAEVHAAMSRRNSYQRSTTDYRGLLYADLQLPKVSNNGSMKVKRNSSQWMSSNNSTMMDHTIDFSFDSNSDTSQSKTFA